MTGPGYLEPSFSPDGRYIAATRINAFGSDVVILDAVRGRELLRLTTDGASWAPTWSPAGDAISFFHIDGQIVDLHMAVLDGRAPNWTVKRDEGADDRIGARWRVASGLVHPGRSPAGDPAAERPGVRIAVLQRPVTTGYLERLAARSTAVGSVLCLGLDPDPAALPDGFSRDLAGIERFARLVVEAAGPYAAAVKPNLAFFEAYGSAGLAALERIRAAMPADVLVVADAKRGDIGSTAARQAVALFDGLGADAVTVNPYLGSEAVAPLIERLDRFAYLLCRTSNPGAGELQDLDVAPAPLAGAPAEPLYARVARLAGDWGPGGTVGLVVGATAPDELAAIRSIAPGLAFLVPGVGAQGGDVGAALGIGSGDGRAGRWTTRRRTARERLAGHRRCRGPGG